MSMLELFYYARMLQKDLSNWKIKNKNIRVSMPMDIFTTCYEYFVQSQITEQNPLFSEHSTWAKGKRKYGIIMLSCPSLVIILMFWPVLSVQHFVFWNQRRLPLNLSAGLRKACMWLKGKYTSASHLSCILFMTIAKQPLVSVMQLKHIAK